ncbi:MAG: ribose-phosphate diphosphokinase [Treponema sp.]|jgi:ribose-phosphate pyrophosphokinase|nr:ribose-phosphate diphosphokinase [Treponema sp.]
MNDFVIVATRSIREYASRVIEHLVKFPSFTEFAEVFNGTQLLNIDRFADGEMEVSISRSVRGQDVILFASCSRNEAGLSVDEAKIELYHTVDALQRSKARSITVFEPFISSSRSDRTTRRNSVGLWVHFKTLASLGVKHIVTYQLHSKISQSILDPSVCSLDDVQAHNLLEKYLCDNYIRDLAILEQEVRRKWAFCSVDAGGENHTKDFANAFGASMVSAHKQRDYSRLNAVKSINILSAEPLEGKILWIVDDMIDTAGSIENLISALRPHNPAEINLIAVHAPFSFPAPERLSRLKEDGRLNRIIVSDTVCPCLDAGLPRIEIVPSAGFSARIVRTLVLNESMGELMKGFNAEEYLKSPDLFKE